MHRITFSLLALLMIANVAVAQKRSPSTVVAAAPASSEATSAKKQFIEVRTYHLVDAAAEERLDAYLADALIPALSRQGLGPIGVLDQAGESDEGVMVKVIIPGPSLDALLMAWKTLDGDLQYQAAAKDYLDTPRKETPLKRIKSEVLYAFDCWPEVTVPKQKQAGKERFFELRSYESSTEKLAALKVEMFNEGEVPIFLDAGIMPVFMGQALIGDQMPNLTYMVAFDDEATMKASWPKFSKHPDWKTLSSVEKYKGTVSKNNKSYWLPKSYSQL